MEIVTHARHRNTYIRRIITIVAGILVFVMLSATAAFASNTYVQGSDEEYSDYAPISREFVTTVNLNFRSGPGTDYPRHRLLNSGTVINIYEYVADGFSPASFNGQRGYVASEFIRPHTRPAASPAAPASAPSAPAQVEINGDVELLHWRYVRNFITLNAVLQVTDVRTGTVFFVRNWSQGNHADVDTLTYEDTQILRRLYGGRWSWDPRPVIVTYNGRNFAAAINGMPHGGTQNPSNGAGGHFCIHFYGSTTHNGNRSYERTMQAAVREAFNSAQ